MSTSIQELTPDIIGRSKSKFSSLEKEIEDLEKSFVDPEGNVQDEGQVQETPKVETKEEEDKDLSVEEKSFKKRYGDLRRFSQQREKEDKERIAELERRLNDKGNASEFPKTREELEAWRAKYPDVAVIIEMLADDRAKERDKDLEERFKSLEEMRFNLNQEKAEAELKKYHPDFDKIREDEAFHKWADEQPEWVKNALYEDTDVKAAARAIDLYKLDNNIKTKTTSNEKNAAAAVTTRTRTTPKDTDNEGKWTESQIAKMSDKDFAKYAEEIDQAVREGKIIYDITGNKR